MTATVASPGLPRVVDCHACHGAAVVRVRFVDNRRGKVRVITCPDCGGRGSWLSKAGHALIASTPSALREKTK